MHDNFIFWFSVHSADYVGSYRVVSFECAVTLCVSGHKLVVQGVQVFAQQTLNVYGRYMGPSGPTSLVGIAWKGLSVLRLYAQQDISSLCKVSKCLYSTR